MITVYLSGPITGKNYYEVVAFFNKHKDNLPGCVVMHPMLGKEFLHNEKKLKAEGLKDPRVTNHAIYERDKWMVSKADIILVDLSTATQVSIGTVFEVAWAALLNKLVVMILPKENINRHSFMLEAADVVFETAKEAYDYITIIAKEAR